MDSESPLAVFVTTVLPQHHLVARARRDGFRGWLARARLEPA